MSSAVFCAVMLTVAVDYGYEPIEGTDGIRYVILVEPAMLDALRDGTPIGSMILPEVRGRIHSFQLVTNYGALSKEIPPLPVSDPRFGPLTPPAPVGPADVGVPTLPKMSLPLTDTIPPEPSLLPRPGKVIPASGTEPVIPLDGPSGTVDTRDPGKSAPPKSDPWFLLAIAGVVACGSSGGMLFFGWLTFDYRSRYLGLLRDSLEAGNSWLEEPQDDRSLATEPLESSVSSTHGSEEPPEASQTEDSAWKELKAETSDGFNDWLDEEKDHGRKSRRNRKRSR